MIIISNNVIFGTKWLEMNETFFVSKDKERGTWYWVSRPNNRSAVVIAAIIMDSDNRTPYQNNKLVVIRERRIPLSFESGIKEVGYEWGLPAGLVDGNETPEETAKRELGEETGYDIKKVLSVSPFVYNSAGLTNESISMVSVEAIKSNKQKLESSEEIEVFEMNKREVREIMDRAKRKEIQIGAKAWVIFDIFSRFNSL